MNKTEFIAEVADNGRMSKNDASTAVNLVLDTIVSALNDGVDVSLPGFGKFYVTDVAERTARNPQTGGEMVVPAHRAPKFKYASNVKADIR